MYVCKALIFIFLIFPQHIRDLNLLIKVFRSAFLSLRCHGVMEQDVDVIFRDIADIHASVVNFHGLLEDMMEMTSENSVPSVPQVSESYSFLLSFFLSFFLFSSFILLHLFTSLFTCL